MEQPAEIDSDSGEKNGIMRDPARMFVSSIQEAFAANLNTPPQKILFWHAKTMDMIDQLYDTLPPVAQRFVHVFASMAQSFPDCATLESMTRLIVKTEEFNPEKIVDSFKRFQVRAIKAGNPVLMQSAAFLALTPLFTDGKLSPREHDVLAMTLKILPPVVFASLGKKPIIIYDGVEAYDVGPTEGGKAMVHTVRNPAHDKNNKQILKGLEEERLKILNEIHDMSGQGDRVSKLQRLGKLCTRDEELKREIKSRGGD